MFRSKNSSSYKDFLNEIMVLKRNSIELTEPQQASLFSKILIKQHNVNIRFCENEDLYISRTPNGYDIVGYYMNSTDKKIPFSISVCKINDLWYPSKRYIAADTHSCSSHILLWLLISLGCTLMGILMYFLMSAAIGI